MSGITMPPLLTPTTEALIKRTFLLGLDLGQARDYSALIGVERKRTERGATYGVGHIERWKDECYPDLVEIVSERIAAFAAPRPGEAKPTIALVIDHTGVGRPVYDLFARARLACSLIGVTITGGEAISQDQEGFHVPKRILASTLQVLLQSGRLHLSAALPLTPALTAELANFRVKISLAGHDSYGAGNDWREGNHDDLVLGAAMACWYGERPSGGLL